MLHGLPLRALLSSFGCTGELIFVRFETGNAELTLTIDSCIKDGHVHHEIDSSRRLCQSPQLIKVDLPGAKLPYCYQLIFKNSFICDAVPIDESCAAPKL